MQPPATSPNKALPAFELKGSLFTLTVLHLLNSDPNLFITELRRHAQHTPNLFKNMPLIIDLQRINQEEKELDFTTLQYQLKQHGLIPVGVRHGNEKQNLAATNAGLPLLSNLNPSNQNTASQNNPSAIAAKAKQLKQSEKKAPSTISHTMVISAPIRSGQQIYAKDASLIVLAQVSNGAEILADGHIHVYGSLRGRALAGIKGDKTARIFCQHLDAELISIAGVYKLHDDLPVIDAPIIQVYLDNDTICVEGIGSK